MPAAVHASRCAAGDDDGQWGVIVDVAVAHAAAVEDQRVIEQVAVAVGGGLEASSKWASRLTWNVLILVRFSSRAGSF